MRGIDGSSVRMETETGMDKEADVKSNNTECTSSPWNESSIRNWRRSRSLDGLRIRFRSSREQQQGKVDDDEDEIEDEEEDGEEVEGGRLGTGGSSSNRSRTRRPFLGIPSTSHSPYLPSSSLPCSPLLSFQPLFRRQGSGESCSTSTSTTTTLPIWSDSTECPVPMLSNTNSYGIASASSGLTPSKWLYSRPAFAVSAPQLNSGIAILTPIEEKALMWGDGHDHPSGGAAIRSSSLNSMLTANPSPFNAHQSDGAVADYEDFTPFTPHSVAEPIPHLPISTTSPSLAIPVAAVRRSLQPSGSWSDESSILFPPSSPSTSVSASASSSLLVASSFPPPSCFSLESMPLSLPSSPPSVVSLLKSQHQQNEDKSEQFQYQKEEEKEEENSSRTFHALMELVQTEKSYLEHLRMLVNVYFRSLPLLSPLASSDVPHITRNASDILNLHERIGVRLDQVDEELGWTKMEILPAQDKKQKLTEREEKVRHAAGRIARIFLDELPNFSLYNQFCALHGEALDIVRSMESTSDWTQYEKQCASLSPASDSTAESCSFSSATGPALDDLTPLATNMDNPPFFPSVPTTALNYSPDTITDGDAVTTIPVPTPRALENGDGELTPLPSSPTFVQNTPFTVTSSSALEVESSAALAHTSSIRSKLRFQDYAISPVQRICRYPLVFGQVFKNLQRSHPPLRSSLSSSSTTATPVTTHVVDKSFAYNQSAIPSITNGNVTTKKDSTKDSMDVHKVWEGFKTVAEGVDRAKKRREGELISKLVADRLDFLPQPEGGDPSVLRPILLVGTLHVLHQFASHTMVTDPLSVKYYGCFLFPSHLLMVKVKKRSAYELKEWLPLRLFEISSVEEGEGLLPHCFRLSHQDHVFDLGATCAVEKDIWLTKLAAAQVDARRTWAIQSEERLQGGHDGLDDDSTVSLMSAPQTTASTASASIAPPSRSLSMSVKNLRHNRSRSTASSQPSFFLFEEPASLATLNDSNNSSPSVNDSPRFNSNPYFTSMPSSSIHGTESFSNGDIGSSTGARNRFTATAVSFLGKTPTAQRAVIDLRLADLISNECLTARAQAIRTNANSSKDGKAVSSRSHPVRSWTTTASNTTGTGYVSPKRALSSAPITVANVGRALSDKARRRMSFFDASHALSSPPNGLDTSTVLLEHVTVTNAGVAHLHLNEHRGGVWGTNLHPSKSTYRGSQKTSPTVVVEMTDTSVLPVDGSSLKANDLRDGAWNSRTRTRTSSLRKVASHPSLIGQQVVVAEEMQQYLSQHQHHPYSSTAVLAFVSSNAEVERNNSVSSTNSSSSGTGGTSNSQNSHSSSSYANMGETPPSSIPSSPVLKTTDLDYLSALLPVVAHSTSNATGSLIKAASLTSSNGASPRWRSSGQFDGVSGLFKLRRRGSALALGPNDNEVENNSQSNKMDGRIGGGRRRGSIAAISSFPGMTFAKRVQSSPALSSMSISNLDDGSGAGTGTGSSSGGGYIRHRQMSSTSSFTDYFKHSVRSRSQRSSFSSPVTNLQPAHPSTSTWSSNSVPEAESEPKRNREDAGTLSRTSSQSSLSGGSGSGNSPSGQWSPKLLHDKMQPRTKVTTSAGQPSKAQSVRLMFSNNNKMTPLS